MGRDSNPLRAFSREQPRVQVPTWLPTAWWMEADRSTAAMSHPSVPRDWSQTSPAVASSRGGSRTRLDPSSSLSRRTDRVPPGSVDTLPELELNQRPPPYQGGALTY